MLLRMSETARGAGKTDTLFIHEAEAEAPGQRTPRRRAGPQGSRLYVFKNKKAHAARVAVFLSALFICR